MRVLLACFPLGLGFAAHSRAYALLDLALLDVCLGGTRSDVDLTATAGLAASLLGARGEASDAGSVLALRVGPFEPLLARLGLLQLLLLFGFLNNIVIQLHDDRVPHYECLAPHPLLRPKIQFVCTLLR